LLEFRNRILEQIAKGSPLKETLDRLCSEAERFFASGSCTVLTVDEAGMIHPLAAPAFPQAYIDALEGLPIGPDVGSCGSAIYHNEYVCVEDIERDVRWAMYRSLALPLGYQACSSLPIRDEEGRAVGALAVYFPTKHAPTKAEREALANCADLCALALARQKRILDRERKALIDALTGLPNRAAFDQALSQMRCELPGSWALFVIDIDNLKVTNDTFGHDAGDELIRSIGRRIASAVAPDTVFRTGGDEFTAILQGRQFLHDLHAAADLVFKGVAPPVVYDGSAFLPQVTIGGAVLAPQDIAPRAVRRNADFALYHAKETLRGGFVLYWPGIGTRVVNRRASVREVTEALADRRIDVRYQPIVTLEDYRIIGFEALSCMKSATGRVLPASMFQEAFADARVSAELTGCVLSAVARDIRTWLDLGLPVQHVGVNISSADFYFGSLPGKIEEAFAASGTPLRHLVIEVTEDVYLGQRDQVVASGINELRTRGIRVALDDFGTGFAALTHLLNIPIDVMKIDRSFVRMLESDHPSAAIIRGILQIARDLGINVVAEGVETTRQIELLRTMGCALAQGFVFSRAIRRAKATEFLRKHGARIPDSGPLEPQQTEAEPPSPRTLRIA